MTNTPSARPEVQDVAAADPVEPIGDRQMISPVQLDYATRLRRKLGAGGVPLLLGLLLVLMGLLATMACVIGVLATLGPPSPPPEAAQAGRLLIMLFALPGFASVAVGLTLVYKAIARHDL